MSFEFAVTTIIELLLAILLVYGFLHEDKVISFEQNVKRIVKGNYRRIKRNIINKNIDRKVLKLLDR